MIEDIKKEISNLTTFNGGHNRMYISDLFKILDKYKEQECNYKKAWEELKETKFWDEIIGENIKFKDAFTTFQELETKHGIGVE